MAHYSRENLWQLFFVLCEEQVKIEDCARLSGGSVTAAGY